MTLKDWTKIESYIDGIAKYSSSMISFRGLIFSGIFEIMVIENQSLIKNRNYCAVTIRQHQSTFISILDAEFTLVDYANKVGITAWLRDHRRGAEVTIDHHLQLFENFENQNLPRAVTGRITDINLFHFDEKYNIKKG